MTEIPSLLNEIAQWLESCEYSECDKMVFLRQWANDLLSATSKQVEIEVLSTIQRHIAGMNSLSDISLSPPTQLNISRLEANQKYYGMLVELDRSVRKKLGL